MPEEKPLKENPEASEEEDDQKEEINFQLLLTEVTRLFRAVVTNPKAAWDAFIKYVFTLKFGFVFVLFILAIYITHGVTGHFDTQKFETDWETNKTYVEETLRTNSSLAATIATLKDENGQLRQERDKYQVLLAPFQALAMTTYTNGSVDQRLEKLGVSMLSVQTNLADIKNGMSLQVPELQVAVNGRSIRPIPLSSSQLANAHSPLSYAENFFPSNRDISIEITGSGAAAAGLTVILVSQIDPTNLQSEGWSDAGKTPDGFHQWFFQAQPILMDGSVFHLPPLRVSTNYSLPALYAELNIAANQSRTYRYFLLFDFPERSVIPPELRSLLDRLGRSR